MKNFFVFLSLIALLLGQSAWADSWTHKGADWSSANGFIVKVPAKFTTAVEKTNLTAKNNDAFAVLMVMDSSLSTDAIMQQLDKESVAQFKGVKFGAAKTVTSNGMQIVLKPGSLTVNGKTIDLVVGEFVKAKNKMAFMTVVVKGDKAGEPLLDQLMESVKSK